MKDIKFIKNPFSYCLWRSFLFTFIAITAVAVLGESYDGLGFVVFFVIFILPFTFLPYNYILTIAIHFFRIIPYIFLSKSLMILEVVCFVGAHYLTNPVIEYYIPKNNELYNVISSIYGKIIVYAIISPLLIISVIRIMFWRKFNLRADYYNSIVKNLNKNEKKRYIDDLKRTITISILLIILFIIIAILLN